MEKINIYFFCKVRIYSKKKKCKLSLSVCFEVNLLFITAYNWWIDFIVTSTLVFRQGYLKCGVPLDVERFIYSRLCQFSSSQSYRYICFCFVEIGSHLNLEETKIYRHLTYLVFIIILDKYNLFHLFENN